MKVFMFCVAALVPTLVRAADTSAVRAALAGLPPDFCPSLRSLVDAAGDGFAKVRGAERPGGEHVWAGTKLLPGASECVVFGGTPPAYSCTLYAGDDGDNAAATYDRGVSALKDCLPGTWKTSEKVDGTHSRTTTATGGAPKLRVVSHDVSGDAYMVELWIDAPAP